MLIYVLFRRKITGCIVHCAHTIKSQKPSPRAPYPLVYCIERTKKMCGKKFHLFYIHSQLPTHTIACHLFGNSMQSWLGNRFLNFNLCNESKIYQTVIIEKRRVVLCKKNMHPNHESIYKKMYSSWWCILRIFFLLCVLVSIYSEAIFRVWLKIWWVIKWNRSVWTWCSAHSSNTTVNRFSPFVYSQMNVVSYRHALRTHVSVLHWTSSDVFCWCDLCLLHHILTCLSFARFVHQ